MEPAALLEFVARPSHISLQAFRLHSSGEVERRRNECDMAE